MRHRVVASIISLMPLLLGHTLATQTMADGGPAGMADPVTIVATDVDAPPDWAVMERLLIDRMNEAAPEFLEKYAERGGRMPFIGKPDDMYEVFGNWPLFYILGGDERIFELSLRQWNAITRQLTHEPRRRVEREFIAQYDWFHNAESYKYFYYFGLADPAIPENIDRAVRFAAMYTGDDPLAPNYDPGYRIMRSPLTGSRGPLLDEDANGAYLINHGHVSLYPFITDEPEPGWEDDPGLKREYNRLYNSIAMRGDTPISLNACALVANAYLYTGDSAYVDWITGYVDAWMDRIGRNGGIIPDNVGLTGKIGEYRDGQWWGGHFGWSARYSIHMIFGALTSAAETTYLVTGDPSYLGLLRSQCDMMFDNARTDGGQLLFPYRYGPDGWHDYRPWEARELSHLYNASMDRADLARLNRLLAGSIYGPRPYDGYNDFKLPVTGHRTFRWESNGIRRDYAQVVANGDIGDERQEQEELNEAPRQLYLMGRNPTFPADILRANHREMMRRISESRGIEDIYTVPGLISEELAGLNPVVTKGLVFLTMGGPQAIYNGGLLQVRLRYFDMDRARPGLPEDVAALVTSLEADRTVVRLVNTGISSTRRVLVQGGAYGEHDFGTVTWDTAVGTDGHAEARESHIASVDGFVFLVELPPSTTITLSIGTRLHVNTPSYRFPWHEARK